MKVVVVGAGYVGLSNAILLSRHNKVTLVDHDEEKISMLSKGISPVKDDEISRYLEEQTSDLDVTAKGDEAYRSADVVFIATPTDYSEKNSSLDTWTVSDVIEQTISVNKEASIVIKSTVPVGFTKKTAASTGCSKIFFSPEFLREGHALYDCFHPSRIIVGMAVESDETKKEAERIAAMMQEGTEDDSVRTMIVGSSEAEAVKLFSNTYLALRVSFFNELDTYAEMNGLNTGEIIKGVGMDSRIGEHYNNPSFGYGGYCLPKDTKQMCSQFSTVPHRLIEAIDESNEARKDHIVSQVLKDDPKTVGVFRLGMKMNSGDFRASSIIDVMNMLHSRGIHMLIYEPLTENGNFDSFEVVRDLAEFTERSDIILANRLTPELRPYAGKVYTRDLFERD